MALLNKLFFPSATSTSVSPVTLTSTASSVQESTSSELVSDALENSALKALGSLKSRPSETIQDNIASQRQNNSNQVVPSKKYLSQFPFNGRQVRVLLYRECEKTGRKLLFDSNALQKVKLKKTNFSIVTDEDEHYTQLSGCIAKNSCRNGKVNTKKSQDYKRQSCSSFIEVCEEYGFKHTQPNPTEYTSIGELAFGSSALSFRGTAFKVHWLHKPSRILFSQVFLTPITSSNVHSSYLSTSTNSLTTPRTSITSEHNSVDSFTLGSFSMPDYLMSAGRQLNLTPNGRHYMTPPLDVCDQHSLSAVSDGVQVGNGPQFSSNYSNATDSGYDDMSRNRMSSDQWSASFQYSAQGCLRSLSSEQVDAIQKYSTGSNYFMHTPSLDDNINDGVMHRRISRNLRTSFENANAINDLIGFYSDTYNITSTTNCGGSEGGNIGVPNYRRASYCANESRSNPEIGRRHDALSSGGIKAIQRRAKLGLAVCITMSESFEEEMELFCSEHVALLESMLGRLRACTERAYINYKEFYQTMVQALLETQQWFTDLFTAQRIKCPIWLSITASGNKYSKSVAEKFIKELCLLLSFADTKDTNFFISTVLTAILTHHLGWISTVAPFNSTSSLSESSTTALEQRAKLLHISQKHPYNALWAQMGDLYGAIGLPPTLARTIIYGSEKLTVERLLNILTYFIRCGEVRRSAKRADFNKQTINSVIQKRKNEVLRKSKSGIRQSTVLVNSENQTAEGDLAADLINTSGLKRITTYKLNLNTISDSDEIIETALGYEIRNSEEKEIDSSQIIRTLKKNEIPTVLAFRDSRFVQQELRIGNYLMDTGIEKKSLLDLTKTNDSKCNPAFQKDGRVRVLITTPENEEMTMEDEDSVGCGNISEDGAMEAIEIDYNIDESRNCSNEGVVGTERKAFFWQVVKEGVSLSQFPHRSKFSDNLSDSKYHHLQINSDVGTLKPNLSLSDLITQNSIGKSDRMAWGIEPRRENVSLEEEIHFDNCQINRGHVISDSKGGVVFTLGENELLVNLKKSNDDLTAIAEKEVAKEKDSSLVDGSITHQLCSINKCIHESPSKRHSGVKFNFEQFPQIATNYMKSKNLVFSNLLVGKSAKLETQKSLLCLGSDSYSLVKPYASSPEASNTSRNCEDCMVCKSVLNSYQTPSNATELEFEADEMRYSHSQRSVGCIMKGEKIPVNLASSRILNSVSPAASIDTLKSLSLDNFNDIDKCEKALEDLPIIKTRQNANNTNIHKVSSHCCSISSVAAKCAAVNDEVHLLKLPVPAIKEISQEGELISREGMKLRAGFVPSLFLGVSDHYISDMVLQGTCAPPDKWKMTLREDLVLSARTTSLISVPAENVAIVANMETWDVRLISSQPQHFPYAGDQSTPVGMSQLVSNILETVNAMNSAGISAYECLAFIEAKMQDIYLQSELLAAFLLETEFCQLSSVTTALNLTDNDVPLLLAIASVHTPEIAKKCGISFR